VKIQKRVIGITHTYKEECFTAKREGAKARAMAMMERKLRKRNIV
jgi:hypothetical protein